MMRNLRLASLLLAPLYLGCGESKSDPFETFGSVLSLGLARPLDTTPPALAITSPTTAPSYVTDVSPLRISGTVSDDRDLAGVKVAGHSASLHDGTWSYSLTLIPGANVIDVVASDREGNLTMRILTVLYTRPTLEFVSPTTGSKFPAAVPWVNLRAEVRDDEPVSGVSWVNALTGETGGMVYDGSGFTWSARIPLVAGTNGITCSVSDAQGHLVTDSIDVLWSTTALFASWGRNSSGQLGHATWVDTAVPGAVEIAGVIAADGGDNHTVALLADGTVRTWGDNGSGQLGDGTHSDQWSPVVVPGLSGVVAVSAGPKFTAAVLGDGTVRRWGKWDLNGLGYTSPVPVSGLTGMTSVSCGEGHFLGLRSDGTVWAWGRNWSGQLGNGTTTSTSAPFQVPGLAGVTAIAAGKSHSLALLSNGTLLAWGMNTSGQVGNGAAGFVLSPAPVPDLSGVTALSAGGDRSVALLADGTVRSWGKDIGPGPLPVAGLTGITAIAAGATHFAARRNDGTVWTWSTGTPVAAVDLPPATFIAAGTDTTFAAW
jgi:alpha-tubulin suppressor-like RCC1 family protein